MKYKDKHLFLILDQNYDADNLYLADWKKSKDINYICIVDNPLYANKIFKIEDKELLQCPISPVINERKANRPIPFRKVPITALSEEVDIDISKIEEQATDYSSIYASKATFRFHQMFRYPGFGCSIATPPKEDVQFAAEKKEDIDITL